MVRNAASMQSLRSNLPDRSVQQAADSAQPTVHEEDEQLGQDYLPPMVSWQRPIFEPFDEQARQGVSSQQASQDARDVFQLPQSRYSANITRNAVHDLQEQWHHLERMAPMMQQKRLQERQEAQARRQEREEARERQQQCQARQASSSQLPQADGSMSAAHDNYIMDMMMREQQNKKRLLMARQGQANVMHHSNVPRSNLNQEPAQMENINSFIEAMDRALQDATIHAPRFRQATRENAAAYTKPFCDFLTDNPTVFHAVDALKKQLKDAGFTEISERDTWKIECSGKYFVERNGSSMIAFVVGANYQPGNGAAILAGHVDALTAKLKPVSQVPNKAGYLQLGVAPYAGGLGRTWWDRDLGIGGRVHIKEGGKIVTKLVKLDWPIAKIPSLAEHFGAPAAEPFINPNKETRMVPIIGLDSADERVTAPLAPADPFARPSLLCSGSPVNSFVQTQPPALVKAIGNALGLNSAETHNIVNWELELFDVQPATVIGLNKELISAGRIDDKLCSWAALQALIESQASDTEHSSLIKVVGLFDDEEIGSLLRQGAKGNFLPITLERAVGALCGHTPGSDVMGRTYANSFMVSSDVSHAVNPNFTEVYLANHAPHLNVGIAIAADSNGHMTTDSVSTTILKRCADMVGAQLQVFQIRNDSRSGGTVGPMLSAALGIRAIDAGLPQLSMHSIRATTGALDPGLGVLMFAGFLNGFEAVDKELQE